jgi:hypothetical protein
MLIKDDQGRRLGWLSNGTFVNEIPGAKVHGFLNGNDSKSEYLYLLPSGINYSASLDGAGLQKEEKQGVTAIGPGYYAEANGLAISEGTHGLVGFSSYMDRYDVSYQCDGRESPRFRAGIQTKNGPAYEFQVKKNSTAKGNESDASGKLASMGVDRSGGRLKVTSGDSDEESLYDLMVARMSEKGPEVFSHSGISLDEGEAMIVDYSDWEGEGYDMSIGIDENDDGSIDEALDLDDEGGSYEDIVEEYDQEIDADDEGDEDQGSDEEAEDEPVFDDVLSDIGGDIGGDFGDDFGGDE